MTAYRPSWPTVRLAPNIGDPQTDFQLRRAADFKVAADHEIRFPVIFLPRRGICTRDGARPRPESGEKMAVSNCCRSWIRSPCNGSRRSNATGCGETIIETDGALAAPTFLHNVEWRIVESGNERITWLIRTPRPRPTKSTRLAAALAAPLSEWRLLPPYRPRMRQATLVATPSRRCRPGEHLCRAHDRNAPCIGLFVILVETAVTPSTTSPRTIPAYMLASRNVSH